MIETSNHPNGTGGRTTMHSRLARSLVAAALLTVGLAGTAQATPGTLNVVALGDSYGSGTGAGNYQNGTGVPNGCWRSANSYSETVVAKLRTAGKQVNFTNVTCSGAATADLSQPFKNEPPQLDALRRDTHVVFLSIGTNDIGFAAYGGLCIAADCSGAPTQAKIAELPTMAQNITAVLNEIKTRSPWARIVMTGYGSQLSATENAQNVPLDPICGDTFFTTQERADGNQLATALDAALRKTARKAGTTYASPYATAGAIDPTFAGHSLCQEATPYYRGFDALAPGQEGQEAVLHLNAQGQTALADLVMSKLRR